MPFQSILFMKKRISLFGLPVDVLTMEETITLIESSINQNKPIHHVVVNAGKIVLMQTDKELEKSSHY